MTKVEEVARAINAAIGDGDASLEVSKVFAKRLARAAIEAMRIPSEGMLNAGVESLIDWEESSDPYSVNCVGMVYAAAITAALGETDE